MEFLEKNLEDIIHSNYFRLVDRGLYTHSDYMVRQVNFPGYGIADLIAISYNPSNPKAIDFEIIELKKDFIDVATLMQACRYQTALKKLLKANFPKIKYSIRISLIGKKIDTKGDFVFLLNFLKKVNVYTYEYDYDGIRFTQSSRTWFVSNAEIINSNTQEKIDDVFSHIKDAIREYRFQPEVVNE